MSQHKHMYAPTWHDMTHLISKSNYEHEFFVDNLFYLFIYWRVVVVLEIYNIQCSLSLTFKGLGYKQMT